MSVVYAFGVEGGEYPPPPPPQKNAPCSGHFPELKSEWWMGGRNSNLSNCWENFLSPGIPWTIDRCQAHRAGNAMPSAKPLQTFLARCPSSVSLSWHTALQPLVPLSPHPAHQTRNPTLPPSQGGPEKVTEKGATKMTPPPPDLTKSTKSTKLTKKIRLFDEIDEIDERKQQK